MNTSAKKERKCNPLETTNILSKLTFFYMFPIFKHTFLKGLSEDDLFKPLNEHKSHVLGEKLETIWKHEYRIHKKSGLHRALFKLFGLNFLLLGFLRLFDEIVLVVAMPLSIGLLVSYFEKDQTEISETEAYIAAGVIVLCRFADALMGHASMMGLMHSSMKMRVACSALIYRKILRLNSTALTGTTTGQIINLLSNDVSKFDQAFVLANFFWIAPIQAAVGTYLLYREIGVSAFFGMTLLLSIIPLQTWFGKKCSILRLRTALRTDERVRLMNEVISGIQVIKMYCWEKPFGQLITAVRRKEMKAIRSRGYLMGIIFCLEMFITRASIFISIVAYVLLGEHITAKKAFALTAIYAVLRPTITTIFSFSVSSIAEVHVSVKRIQAFLVLDEQQEVFKLNLETSNGSLIKSSNDFKSNEKARIFLKDVSAKWLQESNETTLTNISLDISAHQIIAVIGAVGSGKSSLFNVLLRELPLECGEMQIVGAVSYSSQEPWLFSASVRQNILFGSVYDKERYKQVIEVCALKSDFDLFPYGDKTIVGERGKSLSGGQKARINLARCIYKEADIYLLDDPLSAVDANVGKHLYEKCIQDFLKDKICVLITHQLQYLKTADKIIVLDDGKIEVEGKFDELKSSGQDFVKLFAQFEDHAEENPERRKSKSRLNSESTKEVQIESDVPEEDKEEMQKGGVKGSLYFTYLKSGGGYFNAFLMLTIFFSAQVVSSSADYYTTYWVNTEESFNLKLHYNLSFENLTLPRETMIYTYSSIILASIAFGLSHGIYFMIFFALASTTLHNASFSKIIQATMRFYNSNPSGRILNRFSRDLGNIDENIPDIIYDVVAVGLDLLGAVVLSAVVDPWLLIPSLFLTVVFYLFRLVYIETSRSVKRIEGITRSPIYSHMTSSMYGLSTIRAFNAQQILVKEFDDYQDKHSAAFFIFLTSNRCFGYWLDTFCVLFVASALFIMLFFSKGLHGGDLGLVITQYIGLTGAMQWGMRQWSELENQMVSVERLIEYTQVETEPERDELKAVSDKWPEGGSIEFNNVFLKYNPSDPNVLNNLNFSVQSKEKIGIVGRTGAGKSSIINALFQLYPIQGSICIDGVDTTKMPLEELRSKISIIPQEPVLFSGSMRKNLDPFEEYSDEILWKALDEVEMKDVVSELPAGLHSKVSEGGTNFSVGQRQLVCLARALLRNNKILVMDEATANVDPHTDALIQNTIRQKFADCTVLTIAHRLHTVMDADKILLMSSGRAEEFGHPYDLLQKEDGMLYKLARTTGNATALNLANIAKKNYDTKIRSE